MALLTIVSAN